MRWIGPLLASIDLALVKVAASFKLFSDSVNFIFKTNFLWVTRKSKIVNLA